MYYTMFGKRALDLLFATLSLLVLTPLLFIISLAIAWTSAGPILFSQVRIGKDGRPFPCLKFRTMRQGPLPKEAQELAELGVLYKPDADPRITTVGRWLRRASLDELPQLWNVIRGEMSLVGPRPLIPFLVEGYPQHNRLRSRVLPGLTGYWQIYARRDCTSVTQMIEYDARYIDELSFTTDMKVIAKTIPAVILARDAR